MSLHTIEFDHLRLCDNDRLLDLGCGEGRHAISAYLLKEIESVGVDLSIKDLKTTKTRFQDFEIRGDHSRSLLISAASGHALPFVDRTFDKVICSEVLEHIPDYRDVIGEIRRVLKPGGILAVSVPRFFPEWVCWQLSAAYHEVEGGHIRIFNANHLQDDIEKAGFVRFHKHHAHALHVPYWWLKCLFWRSADRPEARLVSYYHKMLIWDLMKRPALTRWLERLLNPVLGKSVVMYFVKQADHKMKVI